MTRICGCSIIASVSVTSPSSIKDPECVAIQNGNDISHPPLQPVWPCGYIPVNGRQLPGSVLEGWRVRLISSLSTGWNEMMMRQGQLLWTLSLADVWCTDRIEGVEVSNTRGALLDPSQGHVTLDSNEGELNTFCSSHCCFGFSVTQGQMYF